MSKHPSLKLKRKPKRQLRVKSCPGQLRASERKRRNKQGKEVVSSEVARQRYLEALNSVKDIRYTEFGYRSRYRDW